MSTVWVALVALVVMMLIIFVYKTAFHTNVVI
jgi:hypothetical protein